MIAPSTGISLDPHVLDRNSRIPLHIQLAERLRESIIGGEYRPGDKLRTEKELGDQLGLSRVTVRSGLALLEREGWIVKRRGLGTFVCDPIEQDLSTVQTTTDVVRARGLDETVAIASFGPVVPPKHIAKALGRAVNQRLLLVEKLHEDASGPIALVRCFLPLEIEAEAELLRSQPSVTTIALWELRLGIKVKAARHQIRAEPADGNIATRLNLKPGSPVLVLDRISYAEDGKALEYISSVYHWRRYRFSIVLPRVQIDDFS
jgi:GntR family transcriptional regulator